MLKSVAVICFTALSAYAQVELQRPYSSAGPHYYFQILNFRSAGNLSRFDFYFQIPHSRLHFVRDGNEFSSSFKISLRMISARNIVGFRDTWAETWFADYRLRDPALTDNYPTSGKHFYGK